MKDPAGMLLVDKPAGWTSHDCVAALRRLLPRATKVGHSGTLDPIATGLLVVLVGPCTRLQSQLQGMDKVYAGTIRLGVRTDSGDITGRVLEQRPIPPLTLESLASALAGLVGAVRSPAPAYSAVKHHGRPLYAYARAGQAIPVKERLALVRAWEALGWEEPELSHRLHCSSGTYVRSLAELLGERLGCGGAVSSLRRESVGPFRLEDARALGSWRGLGTVELARSLAESRGPLEEAARRRV